MSFLASLFEILFYIHLIDNRGDISDPNNDHQMPAICEISVAKWIEALEPIIGDDSSQKFFDEYGNFYPEYTFLNQK